MTARWVTQAWVGAPDPGPKAGVLVRAERVGFEPTDELPRHFLSREARSARLRHLSVVRLRSYTARRPGLAYDGERSGGRADECTGLENRRLERVRGFESLPLRQVVDLTTTWISDCARAFSISPPRRSQARWFEPGRRASSRCGLSPGAISMVA